MRVLYVNNVDLPGRRYNGFDLLDELARREIGAKQAVVKKLSTDPRVLLLADASNDESLQVALRRVETLHSMDNLLPPWGRLLSKSAEFREANVVHYHLIHNGVVSLLDLPFLFSLKPSVWTIHDPWALTGHCIHPMECDRWIGGCETCPDLDRPRAMESNCAGMMWRIKRDVYAKLDVDVVVASEFMLNMVRESPLTRHFDRVHLVPFGIRTEQFLPDGAQAASRALLGIPPNDFLVLLRVERGGFKGLDYAVQALEAKPPSRPTTIITLDAKGELDGLRTAYNLVELGWVDDQDLYAAILSACDVLLMPSTAETFGLMAVEAMAASRPVLSFEGTALESITHAPDCGVTVPMGDSGALRGALDQLAANPEEARRRGSLGSTLARNTYNHDAYVDALVGIYTRSIDRRRSLCQE